jgi:glutathione peroxidase-family protein
LDKNDEPKLYLDSNDEYMDNNGTKVNQSGYLIDKDYNVIDRYGYVIFEKHLLNKKGNIPKVFRKTPIEPSSDCDDLLDIPQKVDPKKINNNKKTIA